MYKYGRRNSVRVQSVLRSRLPVGWWVVAGQTCVAAWQAKGAASQAASYVNLANPGTYDLTTGGVIGWDAVNGWGPSWSDVNRLATSLTPGAVTVNGSVFARGIRSNTNAYMTLIGSGTSFLVSPEWNDNKMLFGHGNLVEITPEATGESVLGFAALQPYKDGAALGSAIAGGGGTGTGTITIGSTAGCHYVGYIKAIAIYSTTLSAADVAALTARMQAL